MLAHLYECFWRPEADIRGLSLLLFIYILRHSLLLNLDVTSSTSLARQLALQIRLYLLNAGIAAGLPCLLGIHLGTGDLNSGPHVCPASTSLTEQSPLPNIARNDSYREA